METLGADLLAALLRAGIVESLAKLVVALVESLVTRLQADHVDAEMIEVAARIVDGIERGHPDWDGETKSRFAADALLHYVRGQAGAMRKSTANVLTELTVVNTDPATGAGNGGV